MESRGSEDWRRIHTLGHLFRERFQAMYFPTAARSRLMTRFIELRQSGRTVEQYEAEFTLLSRYKHYFCNIIIYVISPIVACFNISVLQICGGHGGRSDSES